MYTDIQNSQYIIDSKDDVKPRQFRPKTQIRHNKQCSTDSCDTEKLIMSYCQFFYICGTLIASIMDQ